MGGAAQHDFVVMPLFGLLRKPDAGETLFSLAARYHVLSGNAAWLQTMRDLLGPQRWKRFSQGFFPSGVTEIARCYGRHDIYGDPLTLLRATTPIRYFTRFLAKDEAWEKEARLLTPKGAAKAAGQFGIRRSGYSMAMPLRYCPDCVAESFPIPGYAIWKQEHQLPGVGRCPTHGAVLLVGCRSCSQKFKAQALFLPTDIACRCSSPKPESALDPAIVGHPLHLQYCRISRDFLYDSDETNGAELHASLLGRIQEEFGAPKTLRWADFVDRLTDRFGISQLRIVVEGEFSRDKLVQVLRSSLRYRARLIPVPLAAMIVLMLFDDFEALLKYRPPSRTRLSATLEALPISGSASASYDLREALERHNYVACRAAEDLGISHYTVLHGAFRKGIDGPIQLRSREEIERVHLEVRELILQGFSANKIACRLGVNRYIVGLCMSRHTDALTLERLARIKSAREVILGALQVEGSSRTSISSSHHPQYVLLWKHDRRWMQKHLPEARTFQSRGGHVDKRPRVASSDVVMAERIRQASVSIANRSGRPVRCHSVTLLNEAKLPISTIGHQIDSLPLVKRALEDCAETPAEISLRRLRWALEAFPIGAALVSANWLVTVARIHYRTHEVLEALRAECVRRGITTSF